MQTLYTSPALQIHLHLVPQVLEVEWLDFTSGEDFRAGIRESFRLGQQYAVRGLISNHLLMRAVRADDQQWYEAEALRRLPTLTALRCAARVESADAMNRMAVAELERRNPAPLPFAQAAFATVAEARAWVWATLA